MPGPAVCAGTLQVRAAAVNCAKALCPSRTRRNRMADVHVPLCCSAPAGVRGSLVICFLLNVGSRIVMATTTNR